MDGVPYPEFPQEKPRGALRATHGVSRQHDSSGFVKFWGGV